MPDIAHAAHGPGGAEAELVAMGLGLMLLSFLFRPSQTGRKGPMLVTLGIGVALIAGAFIIPRV